jgi:hypothetical protein
MRRSQPRLATAAAIALLAGAAAFPGVGHAQKSWRGATGVGDSGAGNNSNVMPANPSAQTDQQHIQNQSNAGTAAGTGGGGAAGGGGQPDASGTAGTTAVKKMPPHQNPDAAAAAAREASGNKVEGTAGLVGAADPSAGSGAAGPGEAAKLEQNRGAVGAAAGQPSGAGGNGLLQGNDQAARVGNAPANSTGDTGSAEERRRPGGSGGVANDDTPDAGGIPVAPTTGGTQ